MPDQRRSFPSPATPGAACRRDDAAVEVVVDEPGRLHERVHGRRPDEAEAAPLEILRERARLRRQGRHLGAAREPRRPGWRRVAPEELGETAGQLESRHRVADRRLDLAAVADDPGVARATARHRPRRSRPHARSRTRRRPSGSPRACAGSSATRARPGTPRARAARTARRHRAARSPTRRRGRSGRADRPHTTSSGRGRPRRSRARSSARFCRRTVSCACCRLQRAAWATMIAGFPRPPQ